MAYTTRGLILRTQGEKPPRILLTGEENVITSDYDIISNEIKRQWPVELLKPKSGNILPDGVVTCLSSEDDPRAILRQEGDVLRLLGNDYAVPRLYIAKTENKSSTFTSHENMHLFLFLYHHLPSDGIHLRDAINRFYPTVILNMRQQRLLLSSPVKNK